MCVHVRNRVHVKYDVCNPATELVIGYQLDVDIRLINHASSFGPIKRQTANFTVSLSPILRSSTLISRRRALK